MPKTRLNDENAGDYQDTTHGTFPPASSSPGGATGLGHYCRLGHVRSRASAFPGTRHRPAIRPCFVNAEPPLPSRAPRILVVDDDEGIRLIISAVLCLGGLEVTAVADGQEAWEALHQHSYDLLVTDNEMPRLIGLRLIERIREAGMDLPIILASGTLPAEKACARLGQDISAVLPKPFGARQLLETVRNALPSSFGDAARARVTFGHPEADPQPIQR